MNLSKTSVKTSSFSNTISIKYYIWISDHRKHDRKRSALRTAASSARYFNTYVINSTENCTKLSFSKIISMEI